MEEKSTSQLLHLLNSTSPAQAGEFLHSNQKELLHTERPFSEYFKKTVKSKDLLLQQVFLKADIPERYGYKLVSGEKHTRKRDTILRLCMAAGFSASETQRTLRLYGMPELYPRFARDAVLIIVLNQGNAVIEQANELLEEHGLQPLAGCQSEE